MMQEDLRSRLQLNEMETVRTVCFARWTLRLRHMHALFWSFARCSCTCRFLILLQLTTLTMVCFTAHSLFLSLSRFSFLFLARAALSSFV